MLLIPPPRASELTINQDLELSLRLFGDTPDADLVRLERTFVALQELPIGTEEGKIELAAITRSVPRMHRVDVGKWCTSRITVHLETPARLKLGGKPAKADDLDFPSFFSQLWRRLTRLSVLYGHHEPDDDVTFRHLRESAQGIAVTKRRLVPLRWHHLSMETGERKPLWGLLGQLTFEGDLGPFLPALEAGAITNIGGGTTFGLGRMRVEPT